MKVTAMFCAFVLLLSMQAANADSKVRGVGEQLYDYSAFGLGGHIGDTMVVLACHPKNGTLTILHMRREGYAGYESAFEVSPGDTFELFDAKEGHAATLTSIENCKGTFDM